MSPVGDIKIRWDVDKMCGDFVWGNNDLETDNGLVNAVLVSIFTDKRARPDQRRPDPGDEDLRGYWGDTYSMVKNDPCGSHLWLLFREKTELKVIPRCEQYVRESVQWLIDDGVVSRIDVFAERQGDVGNDRLAFRVRVYRDDDVIDMLFSALWDGTFSVLTIVVADYAFIDTEAPTGVVLTPI